MKNKESYAEISDENVDIYDTPSTRISIHEFKIHNGLSQTPYRSPIEPRRQIASRYNFVLSLNIYFSI